MNFTIVSQMYMPNSNGIKILHKICDALNRFGHDARMLYLNPSEANSQQFVFNDAIKGATDLNAPILKQEEVDFVDTSFVIYPEVVMGNPLKAQKVIRYFGNREGYCNGRSVMLGHRDFILAHSRQIHSSPHYVLFNAEINPCFHDRDSHSFEQRKLDVTYIGKGYIYGGTGRLPNSLYVAREWPTSQEELAMVMRQTRFFFTWDSWTSTNAEAVLCGAVPVILSWGPWKPEELDGGEFGWLPRGEMTEEGVRVDLPRFKAGREEMMRKIAEYSSSWDERVGEFVMKIEGHFQ